MDEKVFWLSVFGVIVFLALAILDEWFISLSIALTLVAILSLDVKVERRFFRQRNLLQSALGNMEGILMKMDNHLRRREEWIFGEVSKVEHQSRELERNMKRLEESFEEKLDRMAEKMISIENDISRLRRNLAASIGSLDERLKWLS
ncbi:MAG: hypothetical protein DRP11_03470, partial [Candidatus Aenigmatarchaeota archaeon]